MRRQTCWAPCSRARRAGMSPLSAGAADRVRAASECRLSGDTQWWPARCGCRRLLSSRRSQRHEGWGSTISSRRWCYSPPGQPGLPPAASGLSPCICSLSDSFSSPGMRTSRSAQLSITAVDSRIDFVHVSVPDRQPDPRRSQYWRAAAPQGSPEEEGILSCHSGTIAVFSPIRRKTHGSLPGCFRREGSGQ